jgi:transcriptional regulator with XRE-family HTH domain
MKDRLLEFLRAENKSSAQLAEEIGVQPSGISHILSGRNNPSLDFVLKMLEKYPFISSEWLLFGKGKMYKEPRMQTLFDQDLIISETEKVASPDHDLSANERDNLNVIKEEINKAALVSADYASFSVRKIVWFFDNNSFEEYYPKK